MPLALAAPAVVLSAANIHFVVVLAAAAAAAAHLPPAAAHLPSAAVHPPPAATVGAECVPPHP